MDSQAGNYPHIKVNGETYNVPYTVKNRIKLEFHNIALYKG